MDYEYMVNPGWDEIDAKIDSCGYEIVRADASKFRLESKQDRDNMPKIHVELDRQDGKIYFSPELYAPALIYDDMDYPDSYEYWVEKWLKAAKLCKLLTSAVLE